MLTGVPRQQRGPGPGPANPLPSPLHRGCEGGTSEGVQTQSAWQPGSQPGLNQIVKASEINVFSN